MSQDIIRIQICKFYKYEQNALSFKYYDYEFLKTNNNQIDFKFLPHQWLRARNLNLIQVCKIQVLVKFYSIKAKIECIMH